MSLALEILVYIFLLYSIIALVLAFVFSKNIKMPKRLIAPAIFFGCIILAGIIVRFIENQTAISIINCSGMFIGETLALVFSLKQSKQR